MTRFKKVLTQVKNRKSQVLAMIAAGALTASAHAAPSGGDFGLGLVLGDPTAITGKYYMEPSRAIDFGLGWHWHHSVTVYGDYLFHFPGAFSSKSGTVEGLAPYVGVGVALDFHDSNHHWKHNHGNNDTLGVSARIPLGIAWWIPRSPVEVFAELVPNVWLIPGLDVDLDAGIGARYFF